MNQNLSSYWIFYTVANAGNISKAAKELYISQPALIGQDDTSGASGKKLAFQSVLELLN